MNDIFRISRALAFLGAGFVVLLGLWTFTFSNVKGALVEFDLSKSEITGAGRNTRSVIPPDDVAYSYQIDGVTYRSSTIGMGFRHWTLAPLHVPDWERNALQKNIVDVYYFDYYPAISVLYRGIDVIVTAVFLCIAFGMGLLNKYLMGQALHASRG